MAGLAQTVAGAAGPAVQSSAIVVVDIEKLFAQTNLGQRFADTIEAEGTAIAMENRRIEAELIDEERDLTEQRGDMTPEAFRALAEAFDTKVQGLRREQDAKARQLGQRSDEMRLTFLTTVQPVLEQVMLDVGAVVMLERRAVFLTNDRIDITERAITLIDAAFAADAPLPGVIPNP